jgi:hypothetical protein
MPETTPLLVLDRTVYINTLKIDDPDVADFLRRVAEEDQIATFVNAVRVGVFCLERAQTNRDTDFVRRQIELLLSEVANAVDKIPGATQDALLAKIGTANGQVLAPIQSLIDQVASTTTARVREVKDLLSQEIDPAKDSSTLGRALRALRDLLDPTRNDSVQSSIQTVLTKIASDDGPLARSVKTNLIEVLQPIQKELNELAKEVRGKEAVAEALANTTQKGISYEEEVLKTLQPWAQSAGAEVHHVGGDNQPGDVLVRIPEGAMMPHRFSVVIEARDRQTPAGRKPITDGLTKALDARHADAAIYVSRTHDGLALEIGDWAEGVCGRCQWVACTHQNLPTAIRFLIVQDRLARLRESCDQIDSHSIEAQLQAIRTSLGRVTKISKRVGDVRGGADEIQREAEALRDEIRGALSSVEDAISRAKPPVIESLSHELPVSVA